MTKTFYDLKGKLFSKGDRLLNSLKDIVLSGWWNNLLDMPNDVQTFWTFRDKIGIQNGIIYKGWKVIIPKSMRNEMPEKIHKSHLGIAASIQKAHDVMYWPNMSNDITSYIRSCTMCNKNNLYKCQQYHQDHGVE